VRRGGKEEMVKFDHTPLFPERKAYTVNYQLSDVESELYQAVTNYYRFTVDLTGSRGCSDA
jgi:hypothetical protein